jgi:hypothetical protein
MSTVSGMNAVTGASTGSGIGMGTAAARAAEIAGYLGGVRAALADLDAGVRDGLLEDLPEHLAEVAAADASPLQARLGSPATFAAELRSAAGLASTLPAAKPTDPSLSTADLARVFLQRADRSLGRMVGYESVREFLVVLQPTWWLIRGGSVVLTFLIASGYVQMWEYDWARMFESLLLALAGGLVSVRLGRAVLASSAGARVVSTIISSFCMIPVLYLFFEFL